MPILTRAAYKHGALPSGETPTLPYLHELVGAEMAGGAQGHDWSREVASWPMLGNDRVGDCAVAGAMHITQQLTSFDGYGGEVLATDDEALAALTALNGYDPTKAAPDGSNPTDVGVALATVLQRWMTTGFVMGGRTDKIQAAVRIDPRSWEHVLLGQQLLGNLYVAAALPIAAQEESAWLAAPNLAGDNAPGSWGMHCMSSPLTDESGGCFVTWGADQSYARGWWDSYVVECYAVLHPAWLTTGRAPSGLDYTGLTAAMSRFAAS